MSTQTIYGITPEASEPEYGRECDGGLANKVSGEDGNKANQAKSIVDARGGLDVSDALSETCQGGWGE